MLEGCFATDLTILKNRTIIATRNGQLFVNEVTPVMKELQWLQKKFSFIVPYVTRSQVAPNLIHDKKKKIKHPTRQPPGRHKHELNHVNCMKHVKRKLTERNENNGTATCDMDCALSGYEVKYFSQRIVAEIRQNAHKAGKLLLCQLRGLIKSPSNFTLSTIYFYISVLFTIRCFNFPQCTRTKATRWTATS